MSTDHVSTPLPPALRRAADPRVHEIAGALELQKAVGLLRDVIGCLGRAGRDLPAPLGDAATTAVAEAQALARRVARIHAVATARVRR